MGIFSTKRPAGDLILAFISAFSSYQEKNKVLISKIQEEMFKLLTDCNIGDLIDLYEKYLKLFSLTEFYDRLLKPVMYRIGDLWEQEKLDVATSTQAPTLQLA